VLKVNQKGKPKRPKLKSTRRSLSGAEWFALAGVGMGLLHMLSRLLR